MITLEEWKKAKVKYDEANQASKNDIEFAELVIDAISKKIVELEQKQGE